MCIRDRPSSRASAAEVLALESSNEKLGRRQGLSFTHREKARKIQGPSSYVRAHLARAPSDDALRPMNAPESPQSAPRIQDATGEPAPTDDTSPAIGRLRKEVELAGDPIRRARLLYEIGELEEQGGHESDASRDYLAAFNAEPEFHEALEALVRTLGRRRSPANFGRLLDTLSLIHI